MIRLNTSIALDYQAAEPGTFILNIQPVENEHQKVSNEKMVVTPMVEAKEFRQEASGNRQLRFNSPASPVSDMYQSVVDIDHRFDPTTGLRELTAAQLPNDTLAYHVKFQIGSSTWTTSALDVFQQRQGVCRDFAHLMIALCRALNIPARFVTGVDYRADPALGPIDFHAYVEALLGDRWYLFDPSDISPVTGLIRIGTGRDAADVSFATIFGDVRTAAPRIWIDAVEDISLGIEKPKRVKDGVSTSAPPVPSVNEVAATLTSGRSVQVERVVPVASRAACIGTVIN